MANAKSLVVIALVCLAAVAAQQADIFPGPVPDKNGTTTSTTATPPTPKPTNATTTPTTTTTTTTTTTPKPTTTSTPKTTTTSVTTSTAKPTTTAKPTPPPAPQPPKQGRWIANYTNTNRTCIVFQAAIQIAVPYKDGNATKTIGVNVPENATAEGQCGDAKTENLVLSWVTDVNFTNTFGLYFEKNDSKFELVKVMTRINVDLPGAGKTVLVLTHDKEEFITPVTKSYKCLREESFNLTQAGNATDSTKLKISHLQIQAFKNATNTNFDEALDCSGSETPDVVPIAVGCALAALVIVVLIAYLIGRRRSQARGYLSM